MNWIEYTGTPPVGFGAIPAGERVLANDGWFWYRSPKTGKIFCHKGAPTVGAGSLARVGAGSTIGQTQGDATAISAKEADDASLGTGGQTHDGFEGGTQSDPPADVYELLTPGGNISGGTQYASYKRPGQRPEIWRFTAQEGYAYALNVDPTYGCPAGNQMDDSGNCVPTPTSGCQPGYHKDSSGNCVIDPGTTPPSVVAQTWWSKLPMWARVAIIAGGGAVALIGAYEIAQATSKKGGPKHHRALPRRRGRARRRSR